MKSLLKFLGFEGQKGVLFVQVSALLCVSLGAAPGAAEPSAVCGAPGKPACPLQHWMRRQMATALAHKDTRELARRFAEIERLNPEPRKWLNWGKFARDGAKAAREGSARGVIAACARCHSIYRPEYNIKYRTRRASPQ